MRAMADVLFFSVLCIIPFIEHQLLLLPSNGAVDEFTFGGSGFLDSRWEGIKQFKELFHATTGRTNRDRQHFAIGGWVFETCPQSSFLPERQKQKYCVYIYIYIPKEIAHLWAANIGNEGMKPTDHAHHNNLKMQTHMPPPLRKLKTPTSWPRREETTDNNLLEEGLGAWQSPPPRFSSQAREKWQPQSLQFHAIIKKNK